MSFFLLVVISFITAALSSSIAEEKGHQAFNWCLAGFFFGPLGLIAAAGLSDRKLRTYIRQIGGKEDAISPDTENEAQKV